MRKIELTKQFRRDFKRESKSHHHATLDLDLKNILQALADDHTLAPRHRDHAITGE